MKALALMIGSILLLVLNSANAADLQKGTSGGPKNDYATAFKELMPLAEQGNADAEACLGHMLTSVRNDPEGNSEGIGWLRNAANQRNAFGLYYLGLSYSTGQVVPQDPVAAYALFSLAIAPSASYPKIAQASDVARKKAMNRMTSAQIEAGQKLIREIQRVGALDALDSGDPTLAVDPRRWQVPPFQIEIDRAGIWLDGRLTDEPQLKVRLAMFREQFPRPEMKVIIKGDTNNSILKQMMAMVLADAEQYGFVHVPVAKG